MRIRDIEMSKELKKVKLWCTSRHTSYLREVLTKINVTATVNAGYQDFSQGRCYITVTKLIFLSNFSPAVTSSTVNWISNSVIIFPVFQANVHWIFPTTIASTRKRETNQKVNNERRMIDHRGPRLASTSIRSVFPRYFGFSYIYKHMAKVRYLDLDNSKGLLLF